jgi:hypothetical protein
MGITRGFTLRVQLQSMVRSCCCSFVLARGGGGGGGGSCVQAGTAGAAGGLMNDAWVEKGIEQGATFYTASPANDDSLYRGETVAGGETYYGREYRQVRDAGYTPDGDYLRPPRR